MWSSLDIGISNFLNVGHSQLRVLPAPSFPPPSSSPLPTAPSAPTNFSVTAHNDTTLVVSFSLPSEINGVLRLFQIQYQFSDMGSKVLTLNVTVDVGNTSYRVLLPNLSTFMMYSIRVRAATGAGFGPFTPAFNLTTLEAGECMCVRDTSTVVAAMIMLSIPPLSFSSCKSTSECICRSTQFYKCEVVMATTLPRRPKWHDNDVYH